MNSRVQHLRPLLHLIPIAHASLSTVGHRSYAPFELPAGKYLGRMAHVFHDNAACFVCLALPHTAWRPVVQSSFPIVGFLATLFARLISATSTCGRLRGGPTTLNGRSGVVGLQFTVILNCVSSITVTGIRLVASP